jgi:Domain of unknown function (DUF397)
MSNPLTGGWRKSSFSANTCVEVWRIPGVVQIRNSSDDPTTGAILTFSDEEWAAFTAGVKAGEFDYPRKYVVTGPSGTAYSPTLGP